MSAQHITLFPTALKLVQSQDEPPASPGLFEPILYFCRRVCSCRHRNMSRPFTQGSETYRVCLLCGMHRCFDLKTWQTHGPYYNDVGSVRRLTQDDGRSARTTRYRRFQLTA